MDGQEFYETVQREQEMEESMDNIYQRMAKVMQSVSYVQKEDKRVNNQYTFVSHDAVTAKIRPALLEAGIMPVVTVKEHSQDGNRTEATICVKLVNIDNPNDFVQIESFGYGIDPQDKGPGKAISYAFKYAMLKLFCLETGDDPERDSYEHQPAPKAESKKKGASEEEIRTILDYIGVATAEKALQNLWRQAQNAGANEQQMEKVTMACADRKAVLLGSQA